MPGSNLVRKPLPPVISSGARPGYHRLRKRVHFVCFLIFLLLPLGIMGGLLGALITFGRFTQSAQYATIEGQPGAAAAILQSMRGGWTVTPAVAANRNMDVVHRAVGKPGVVLVGEGSPNRLPNLLAAEKKRISRVAYDVPITLASLLVAASPTFATASARLIRQARAPMQASMHQQCRRDQRAALPCESCASDWHRVQARPPFHRWVLVERHPASQLLRSEQA